GLGQCVRPHGADAMAVEQLRCRPQDPLARRSTRARRNSLVLLGACCLHGGAHRVCLTKVLPIGTKVALTQVLPVSTYPPDGVTGQYHKTCRKSPEVFFTGRD